MSEVVPFTIVPQGGPRIVKLKPRDYSECEHRSVELDEKHRRLECKRCQREVDPFYYLKLLAYEELHLDNRYKALQEFQEKERKRETEKKAECVSKDHPIAKNRHMCRCREMTRWQKEHPTC